LVDNSEQNTQIIVTWAENRRGICWVRSMISVMELYLVGGDYQPPYW